MSISHVCRNAGGAVNLSTQSKELDGASVGDKLKQEGLWFLTTQAHTNHCICMVPRRADRLRPLIRLTQVQACESAPVLNTQMLFLNTQAAFCSVADLMMSAIFHRV